MARPGRGIRSACVLDFERADLEQLTAGIFETWESHMKSKKTVTGAVLAANRRNAKSSTGPRTERGKHNTSQNALQHRILAKEVVLETDEERAEFQELVQTCSDENALDELLRRFVADEIATQLWKLRITLGLETRELARRREAGDEVDRVFHSDLDLPISNWDLPIDRGWDCERIVVRAVAGKDNRTCNAQRGPAMYQGQIVNAVQRSQNTDTQEAGHLEVEAVMGSSLEKIVRYQSALKRDLYRAIEIWRELQAQRREREEAEAGDS